MTKKNTKVTAAGAAELSEGEMQTVHGGKWKVSRTTVESPGELAGGKSAYQTGGSSGDVVPVEQFSLNYEKIRG